MSEIHEPLPGEGSEESRGEETAQASGGCPVAHGQGTHPTSGNANRGWWPNQLNLKILRKHTAASNPMDAGFDYAAAFNSLDLDAVRADIEQLPDLRLRRR